MKYLLILPILLLTGCLSFTKPVPVKQEFPAAPEALKKKCEELKTIEPQAKGVAITELLKTVIENYTLYHECSNRVDGWNEWYNDMKNIHDKAGK